MQKILYSALVALAVVSSPVSAGVPGKAMLMELKGDSGGAVASEVEVKATITAIDPKKRTATAKLADGRTRKLTISEGARNLDQVKVGDILTMRFMESLVMNLEKAPGAKPSKIVTEDLARAKKGDKPAGVMRSKITVVGKVSAIDEASQVVTVRGPEDEQLEITVKDPARLKLVKAGDLVRVVYTEAFALSVTAPTEADTKKK
jgi:Cu/Ag efflux protein CusF